MRGIVLFAHGARDPEWARPFEAIRDRLRTRRPELPVCLAFLEMMSPPIGEAIDALVAQGASSITVFPLFMAQGGHLKQDVPKLLEAVRSRHPGLPIALQAALGDVEEIRDFIAEWVLARA